MGARDDARPRARRRAHRAGRAARRSTTAPSSSPSTTPPPARPELDLEATKAELLALGEAGATIAIRQRRAPVREVVVATDAVPGFGWRTYRAVDGPGPGDRRCAPTAGELANEHLRVEVDPDDGTLTIDADGVVVARPQPLRRRRRRRRHLQLLPAHDRHRGRPARGGRPSRSTESGPVRARLVVTVHLPVARPRGRRRAGVHARAATTVRDVDVVTTLELRAGERFLRVHVELDHDVRDHRLRAHFPLPGDRRRVRRRVRVRGRATAGSPPRADRTSTACPRSCRAGSSTASADDVGLALLHDGLLEYEVVRRRRRARAHAGAGHGLPLAIGARRSARTRPDPLDPLEGPQLQGRARARLRGAPAPRRLARRRAARRGRRLPRAARTRARRWLARCRRRARPGTRSGSTVPRCRRSSATTPARSWCGWSTSHPSRRRSRSPWVTAARRRRRRPHRCRSSRPSTARPRSGRGSCSRSASTAPDEGHRRGSRRREQGLAACVGRAPGRVEAGDGEARPLGGLPEQSRSLAVPADRVRHRTASGRRVAHVERLAVPLGRPVGRARRPRRPCRAPRRRAPPRGARRRGARRAPAPRPTIASVAAVRRPSLRRSRPVRRPHADAASGSRPQSSSTATTAGVDLPRLPGEHRGRARSADRSRQRIVGQLDLHPAVELRGPPPRHGCRVRERAGFDRTDAAGAQRDHGPQRRPVRDRVQERGDEARATVPSRARTGRRRPARSSRALRSCRRRPSPTATVGRVVRSALRPSTKRGGDPPSSTALAPRTTNATTNGAGDSLAISTTATSPTSPAGAPNTAAPRHRRAPASTVCTTGMSSMRCWRTAASRAGTCQRSSAPIHQSRSHPAARRDRGGRRGRRSRRVCRRARR